MSYPDNTGWTIESVGADMWTSGFGDGQCDAVANLVDNNTGRSVQFIQTYSVQFEHVWNGETNDAHRDMSLDEADGTYNEIVAETEEGDEVKRGYWMFIAHETWDAINANGDIYSGEMGEPADTSWWKNLDYDGPAEGGNEFDAVVEDTIKASTKNDAERTLVFCDMEEIYAKAIEEGEFLEV